MLEVEKNPLTFGMGTVGTVALNAALLLTICRGSGNAASAAATASPQINVTTNVEIVKQ